MSAVVPVLLIRMRRIVQAFRRVGATDPGRAIVPSEHGVREDLAFRRLVQRGVLVAVNPQRYYMNEEAEARYRKQRQRVVLIVTLFGLALFILTWLTARR